MANTRRESDLTPPYRESTPDWFNGWLEAGRLGPSLKVLPREQPQGQTALLMYATNVVNPDILQDNARLQ